MIYLCNDGERISKNIITFKDRYELEQAKKSIRDNMEYQMSLKLIDECFVPRFQDKNVTNLLFFDDEGTIEILRDIFLSDMGLESKKKIINDMKSLRDFCYFSHNILDNIEFQQIGNYDIKKKEEISKISSGMGIISEASDILDQKEKAQRNQKVLTLARKIRKL